MSIESVMPSYHLILCHPLLLLPSILPSIRVFPNESALCITWPKYWSFSFSISPSNEYSGLIPFKTDWLDLLGGCDRRTECGREELTQPEDRGGAWEDQPHIQGAVAAQAQEGLEKLSHVEGQEGRR